MSKPTFFQIVKSVFAAFIGVQSKKNQQRDFAEGDAANYIFVGIAMTLVFIVSLIFIVNLITAS